MFMGAILLFGFLGSIAGFVNQSLRASRVKQDFIHTTCTVLDKRLDSHTSTHHHGGRTSRSDVKITSYRPEILIRYQVAGQDYDIWTYDLMKYATSNRAEHQAVLDRYEVGGEYPCWYNPANPQEAVLTREARGLWLFLVVGLGFGAMGAAMTAALWLMMTFRKKRIERIQNELRGDSPFQT